jgi:hypothetical protein
MANQDKQNQGQGNQGQNQGQQKLHTVTNPATGESRQITQEQWRNRKTDASLEGFERVDEETPDGGATPQA